MVYVILYDSNHRHCHRRHPTLPRPLRVHRRRHHHPIAPTAAITAATAAAAIIASGAAAAAAAGRRSSLLAPRSSLAVRGRSVGQPLARLPDRPLPPPAQQSSTEVSSKRLSVRLAGRGFEASRARSPPASSTPWSERRMVGIAGGLSSETSSPANASEPHPPAAEAAGRRGSFHETAVIIWPSINEIGCRHRRGNDTAGMARRGWHGGTGTADAASTAREFARGLARGGASGGFPIWVGRIRPATKRPIEKRRFHFLAQS